MSMYLLSIEIRGTLTSSGLKAGRHSRYVGGGKMRLEGVFTWEMATFVLWPQQKLHCGYKKTAFLAPHKILEGHLFGQPTANPSFGICLQIALGNCLWAGQFEQLFKLFKLRVQISSFPMCHPWVVRLRTSQSCEESKDGRISSRAQAALVNPLESCYMFARSSPQ